MCEKVVRHMFATNTRNLACTCQAQSPKEVAGASRGSKARLTSLTRKDASPSSFASWVSDSPSAMLASISAYTGNRAAVQ